MSTPVPGDPVFDYLTGQMNAAHPPLVEAFIREGEAAVAALAPVLDRPYGPHPRETFDLFRAPAATATLLYLHAGYWQGRDKAQFRFLAPPFVAAGCNVALANYPLCPDVSLAGLTDSVRHVLKPLIEETGAAAITVIGHSAGAHLAVELALTDWRGRGLGRAPIAAIVGLSGVYDLAPLLATPLNDKLRLDPESARAASPVFRAAAAMPPALFAVGARETAAFQAQTAAMAGAWRACGNEATAVTIPDADHFTLLRHLADPGAGLAAEILRLVRETA